MAFGIVLIDDVAPVIGQVGDDSFTNDASPLAQISLAGSAASIGDTLELYDADLVGGAPVRIRSLTLTAADLTRGHIDLQLTGLTPEWHALTAQLFRPDATQVEQATSLFAVATTPPSAPVILSAFDDVGPVQGALASGATTDDRDPSLHIYIPDRLPIPQGSPGHPPFYAGNAMSFDSHIQLLEGGQVVTTVTLAGFYGDTVDIVDAGLTPGLHTFTAVAVDRAGNVSAPSAPFSLVVAAPETPKLPTKGDDTIVANGTNHYLTGLGGSDNFVLSKAVFGAPSASSPAWSSFNFIGDFQGAGATPASANDRITLTGFGAEASLHLGSQSTGNSHLYYYYVQDQGQNYWFALESTNGKALGASQDVFWQA